MSNHLSLFSIFSTSSRKIFSEYHSATSAKLSEMEDSLSNKCKLVTELAEQMKTLLAMYAKKMNDYEDDKYYENGSYDLKFVGGPGNGIHRKTKSHLANSVRPVASTSPEEGGIGTCKSSRIDNNKSGNGIGRERGSMHNTRT